MRCSQCGFEAAQGAAFCSRCGARLFAPRPAAVREYALLKIRPSLWNCANVFILGVFVIGIGARTLYVQHDLWRIAFGIIGAGILIIAGGLLGNRATGWSVTSDRIIERRGLLAVSRREMELADIRSVEVSQRLFQRMLGLGDVTIASAASTDFMIRMHHIARPNEVAETVRKARLKRLA